MLPGCEQIAVVFTLSDTMAETHQLMNASFWA
jgi:hypothetical protein